MGRYYYGDIQGKFWFGLQSSDAASQFGGEQEIDSIPYYYSEESMEEIIEGLKNLLKDGGYEKIRKVNHFFLSNLGYNSEMLKEKGLSEEDVRKYADFLLGMKIKRCVKLTGECSFEANIS